ELTAAVSAGGFTTVEGTLTSAANTTFSIELFVNAVCHPSGYGEGERFFASLTVATDADGLAAFAPTVPLELEPGHFVAATAPDPTGNTSEFSACAEVAGPGAPDAGAPPPVLGLVLSLGLAGTPLRRADVDAVFGTPPGVATLLPTENRLPVLPDSRAD